MKIILLITAVLLSNTLCAHKNFTEDNGLETGNLHVEVQGIKKLKGQVGILLFDQKEGFPTDPEKALKEALIPVKEGIIQYSFTGLPFGQYAIAIMHDENMNNKLDTNLLGIPKEGTGVSKNVKGMMGAPKYQDAAFMLNQRDQSTIIKINY